MLFGIVVRPPGIPVHAVGRSVDWFGVALSVLIVAVGVFLAVMAWRRDAKREARNRTLRGPTQHEEPTSKAA